ncbi:MAG: hypothetical protein JJ959_01400 [Nisaea sp.]|nr:hypothetical protein [Nisaea sp.]
MDIPSAGLHGKTTLAFRRAGMIKWLSRCGIRLPPMRLKSIPATRSGFEVMIEIYIECWASPEGVRYPWSIWKDGRQMDSSHATALYEDPDQAEAAAREYCADVLKASPDNVVRL